MADYNRLTVWTDGSPLTPNDLNAEFDAIKTVINGSLEEANFASGVINSTPYINAADERFQTGGLDAAELVSAAIAEAVAGDVKVVLIPRTLFGYAEEAGFGPSIFDSSILLVREGQTGPYHDPVAYGAKPGDNTVDDKVSFQAAFDAAAAAAIGSNPGAGWVGVTLPGEYHLGADVEHDDATGYLEGPGVTFDAGGAGIVTSASATAGIGKLGPIPFLGLTARYREQTILPTTNIAGSSSATGSANFGGLDPDDWIILNIEASLDEDTSGSPTRAFGLGQVQAKTTSLTFTITQIIETANEYELHFEVTNDAGAAHDAEVVVKVWFVKREVLGA